jgi:adenine specific DNA methylase Mod
MEAPSPSRNALDCGDNLYQLARLPTESIDLIYLDPPFFSNRQYEVIWGDEAEIRSFEDRWEGGINVYINWMRERLVEMYRLLKPTGSLYLHCDWHASHYLKVVLEEIFGEQNFLNNIVWCYGLGGSSNRYWPRKYDDILWVVSSGERDTQHPA